MTPSVHVERTDVGTSDPEEAHATLTAMYADHTPSLSGDRANFSFSITGAGVDLLRIDELTHSMALESRQTSPYDALIAVELRGGRINFTNRRSSVALAPGEMLLGDPQRPNLVHWSDVRLRTTRLDLAAARRVVEDVTGVAASNVHFELSSPVSEAAGRYCRSVVDHIARDVLAHDELLAQPLVRGESFRQLVLAFLSAFPNTAVQADGERAAPRTLAADPAVVRRAVDFVDANAARDIGLGEIADAARIGPRGLQHAFRKYRGCSPTEYLRRVRMENAHRDLREADPTRGDTVAVIAARWGFLHAGRFSIGYRETYGQSPSQTLRG